MKMEEAYKEVQACIKNNQHNVSTEALQLCLEALRIVLEEEHNGMSNYPTWLVASEIDNTDFYHVCYKLSQSLKAKGEDNFTIIGKLSRAIEDFYTADCSKYKTMIEKASEKSPLNYGGSIWTSMLNHCDKDLINYREVARRFLNDDI